MDADPSDGGRGKLAVVTVQAATVYRDLRGLELATLRDETRARGLVPHDRGGR